jgi:hypothetical protein
MPGSPTSDHPITGSPDQPIHCASAVSLGFPMSRDVQISRSLLIRDHPR